MLSSTEVAFMKSELAVGRLKDLLYFDPVTGLFARRRSRSGKRSGTLSGTATSAGYVSIGIDRKKYQAHRLAWLYVYGVWPGGQIDHINGGRNDNRIDNLRDVLPSQNMENYHVPHKTNKCGLLGVHFHDAGGWRAQIRINGKKRYLGTFATPQIAHDAYLAAKREAHKFSNVAAGAGPMPAQRILRRRVAYDGIGVSRKGMKWRAYTPAIEGRQVSLGSFASKDEALAARAAYDRTHL